MNALLKAHAVSKYDASRMMRCHHNDNDPPVVFTTARQAINYNISQEAKGQGTLSWFKMLDLIRNLPRDEAGSLLSAWMASTDSDNFDGWYSFAADSDINETL